MNGSLQGLEHLTAITELTFDGTNHGATASTTYLSTALFLIVMSIVTAPANGFLLFALIKDPLKCFHSPSILLVKSMSAANVMIGVLVEPLYCAMYMSLYKDVKSGYLPSLGKTAQVIAFLANNTSIMTVAALSVDHLTAVCIPLWYKTKLTTKKIAMIVLIIWVYSAVFGFLALTKIPAKTFHMIDLYANTTTAFVLLLSSYVLLGISYLLHLKKSQLERIGTQKNQERRFLALIFVLVLSASVTGFPSFISWYIYHYCKACLNTKSFYFSFEIVQNLFYLKFATDPFLYAWRLPRYRKSLYVVLCCVRGTYNVSREHRSVELQEIRTS